jgi:acyl dehydratase
LCGGDPKRLKSMSARFTRPVMPGDELTVQAWQEGGAIRFRTLGAGGHPVLDFGTLTLAS